MTLAYIQTRRMAIRDGLNALYTPLYDELLDALDQTGQLYWCPTTGLRDLKEQALLYAQGRTAPGAIVTNAPAGESAHDWGCATDFAYFDPSFSGQDFWNKADWDLYRDVVNEISGLTWGGTFQNFPDRPHNELKISVSWADVGRYFQLNGEELTLNYIRTLVR